MFVEKVTNYMSNNYPPSRWRSTAAFLYVLSALGIRAADNMPASTIMEAAWEREARERLEKGYL